MSDATTFPRQDPGLPPGVSAQDIPGNTPPPVRVARPYKRGECKADIAVQRHELMRENIALKNELAAVRNANDMLTIERDRTREEWEQASLELRAIKAARCRWCPARWGRKGK